MLLTAACFLLGSSPPVSCNCFFELGTNRALFPDILSLDPRFFSLDLSLLLNLLLLQQVCLSLHVFVLGVAFLFILAFFITFIFEAVVVDTMAANQVDRSFPVDDGQLSRGRDQYVHVLL